MSGYQIPTRDFARQVRTVALWALVPIVLVAVPLTWILVVTVDTSSDADAILTAQDQADRNLQVQACTTEYDATVSAWDGEHDRILGRLAEAAFTNREPPPELLERFVRAGEAEAEVNRRRLGLSELARDEVLDRTNGFACPSIPERLRIEPLDPTDPEPPPAD